MRKKKFTSKRGLYVGSGVRAHETFENGSRMIICDNCQHKWIPRLQWPNNCPNCGSPIDWDIKPTLPKENLTPEPDPEPLPTQTMNEKIPELPPANIDHNIPETHDHMEDELNNYDPDLSIPELMKPPDLRDTSTPIPRYDSELTRNDPLSSTQPEPESALPPGLRFNPSQFKTRDQLIREQQSGRQQIAGQPLEQDEPAIDLSQIFTTVAPLLAGSLFRDTENQSKASAVLFEFLNKNGKQLSKRILGAVGSAAGGGGGGYDPMVIELGMAIVSMVMMKMNENKKETDIEEAKDKLEGLQDQLNNIKPESEGTDPPAGVVMPTPTPEPQRPVFRVVPRDEDLENMEKPDIKQNNEIGGMKMGNEIKEELQITDDEIREVLGIFRNIPPFIAKPLIEKRENILGQEAYKQIVIGSIKNEDPAKLEKMKKALAMPFEDLYTLVDNILSKENLEYHEMLCNPNGKEFLKINLDSLRGLIKESGL